jgi:F1F0 ATPase subunit 2
MTFYEIGMVILCCLAGGLLGGVFFGGLWWTVRRALPSPHPAAWFLISLVVRFGIVGIGFYLLTAGSWQRWIAALGGFLMARWLITKATKVVPPSLPQQQVGSRSEVGYAAKS